MAKCVHCGNVGPVGAYSFCKECYDKISTDIRQNQGELAKIESESNAPELSHEAKQELADRAVQYALELKKYKDQGIPFYKSSYVNTMTKIFKNLGLPFPPYVMPNPPMPKATTTPNDTSRGQYIYGANCCPRCGSDNIAISTYQESNSIGCGMVLLYIFLFLTVLGWLVLIPLLIQGNQKTVKTMCVCRNCGNKWYI